MKKILTHTAKVILLLLIFTRSQVLGQLLMHNPPASDEEIKKAYMNVSSHPDSLKAHSSYIYTMGLDNPHLIEQYKTWMEKYPDKVSFPIAIGTAFYNTEMPQAREYLLKAAAITPKNASIWFMLSIDELRWGRRELYTEYMKKAMLADTANADYASSYLFNFEYDPDFSQRVFDFIKRFPNSERSPQALYWLAVDAANYSDKIKYFETLRRLYPHQKFHWSASGMIHLADLYLETDAEKALAIINEMGDEKDWKLRRQVAESLIHINKLEQTQNYKDAVLEIDQLKLPSYNLFSDFIALRRASLQEKAGNVKEAYEGIAVKFAKLPSDQLDTALEGYGKKLGKDKVQIENDVKDLRYNSASAVDAYPFELGLYTSEGKLKLNDLKGKVVLLTFWFPGCGPCRREFPDFEAVMNKFKDKDVVYLGINVMPEQEPYVLPLLKNAGYSFIPLRGTNEFAEKYYAVRGEPENFIIDKNGKIIFRDFSINNTNHRTLELMISSLLVKDNNSN